jgi:hypothetical protein
MTTSLRKSRSASNKPWIFNALRNGNRLPWLDNSQAGFLSKRFLANVCYKSPPALELQIEASGRPK